MPLIIPPSAPVSSAYKASLTTDGTQSVAACGDSLIAGVDVGSGASTFIQAMYRNSGAWTTNGNYGVGGTTTDQIATQIPAALATNPGFVAINGGVNDIGQKNFYAISNILTLFAKWNFD